MLPESAGRGQHFQARSPFIIVRDKLRLQSWAFDLFIVSRNLTLNIAIVIL